MTTTNWGDDPRVREHFPDVEPNIEPLADLICFQIKRPRTKIGNLYLPVESQEYDKWNTLVAKVVKLGPLAFKNPETQEYWPEGKWADVGDFVLIPKYGAMKIFRTIPGTNEKCLFALLRAKDMRAKVLGNPVEVEEYE